jgi:AraC-type DNA-binding domain-containing proteins
LLFDSQIQFLGINCTQFGIAIMPKKRYTVFINLGGGQMYQPLLLGHEQFVVSVFSINGYPSHWHSEMEIIYCISGSLHVKINGHTFFVKSSQAVVISSTEEHEFLPGEEPAKLLLIEFGFSFLGSKFSELAKLQFPDPLIEFYSPQNIDRVAAEKMKQSMQFLIDHMQDSGSVETSWMRKGMLYTIAALVLKYVPHDKTISEKRQKRMKAILNSQLAFEYIRNNYQSNISIEDVAKITGYEKSNFCKQFKNATQTSFHQYLNSYRIGLALRLLESEEYTIHAVGETVGIPEAKSFSRIFRQVMQMTPTEYQNRKGLV